MNSSKHGEKKYLAQNLHIDHSYFSFKLSELIDSYGFESRSRLRPVRHISVVLVTTWAYA